MTHNPDNARPARRILVLGASGMLGHTLLRYFAASEGFSVVGSVRSPAVLKRLPEALHPLIVPHVDVENLDSLTHLFAQSRPDVVINAVGLVKQLAEADEPLSAIPINALLPHRLAQLCQLANARLVHVSTDCVFSGSRGGYVEGDQSDAYDLYGRSKFLGEVDYPNAVTLRTSIIGHELGGAHGLVGWFLGQQGTVKGFTRAVFSGVPTVELARIIRDFVIPHPELHGVYHVSAEPITKYDLLKIVGDVYAHPVEIVPSEQVVLDRSLDSGRFRTVTGYQPPAWPELVRAMRDFG